MFLKGKERIVRRIVAMMLAILMVFSTMPLDNGMFVAAEGDYTFTVTDVETGNVINDAVVSVYDTTSTQVCTANTGAAGVEGQVVFDATIYTIEAGYSYTVTATGYKTITGIIDNSTDISVGLSNKVNISGRILDSTSSEVLSDASVVLKQNDVEIGAVTTLEDGIYSFSNVEIGSDVYTIEVSKDGYTPIVQNVDISAVTNDVVTDIALTKGYSTYSFIATEETGDGSIGTAIGGAIVIVYDTASNPVAEGITGASGVPGQVIFDGNSYAIEVGFTYSVAATGYKTVNGTIGNETDISVVFSNKVGVSGRITDSILDEAIADVKVVLKQNDIQVEEVITAADGMYAFTGLVIGNTGYTLEITKDSYIIKNEVIDVSNVVADVQKDIALVKKTVNGALLFDNDEANGGEVSKVYGSGDFSISATGVTEEITYESSNEDVAIVDDAGKVKILKVGETIISASIEESANFAATTISYKLIITKAEQADFEFDYEFTETAEDGSPKITLTYGDEIPDIVAIGQAPDATVSYEVSTATDVITVAANGKVTINKAGIAKVKVTSDVADESNYKDVVLEYTIEVLRCDIELEFDKENIEIFEKATTTNTLSTVPTTLSGNYEIEYSVDDDEILTVEKDASNPMISKITAKKEGTAVVTVTITGDGYNTTEETYTVKVKKKTPNPAFVFDNDEANDGDVSKVYDVGSFKISATGVTEEITYESSNEDVAIVDDTGKVKILKVGMTTISASIEESANFAATTISYELTVTQAKQKDFAFDYIFTETADDGTPKISLTYGDVMPVVNVKGQANDARIVYVLSEESDVVSVEENGTVTANKAGTAKIKIIADVTDESNYVDAYLEYTISIAKADQVIDFAQDNYEMYNGEIFNAPVISYFSKNDAVGNITYTVKSDSNGVVSKIDPVSGAITFSLNPGEVVICATREADDRYNGAIAEYRLLVKEWDPFAGNIPATTYYSIDGDKKDVDSEWFTSTTIKLIVNNGYELYGTAPTADANGNAVAGNQELTLLSIEDGANNKGTFYLRELATGRISKQCIVEGIKVDTTNPTAIVKVNGESVWSKVLYFITFGLAGKNNPELEINTSDDTSKVKETYYYIGNGLEVISDKNELESQATWVEYNNVVKLTKEQCNKNIIYVKVVDNAGNTYYGSTKGIIFDSEKPVIKSEIITVAQNEIYNGNVELEVAVDESEPSSGLKEISYTVICDSVVTQEGTLYSNSDAATTGSVITSWDSASSKNNIVVNANKNNSNNIEVKITAIDNAGNPAEKTTRIAIDTSQPQISVEYDNNNGDTSYTDGTYFNQNRIATVKVKERNFDVLNTKIVVTNTDGVQPVISEWKKTSEGTGNADNATYTATVSYGHEGDYTFEVVSVDLVGNKNAEIDYGTSLAPTKFTIDKTAPVISISYDNNTALNDNYYNADRTGTITVIEHNFDAPRFTELITASDNGQPIAAPTIAGWSSSGDTHTATISFNADAEYKVDFNGKDKAGNKIVEFVEQIFYVDKTNPEIAITEISDMSANNDDVISLVLTATDTNFDVFTPELEAIVKTESGFSTIEVSGYSVSEIANGQVMTIDNLERDGIYSLKCTVIDKAGNEYSEVSLEREDGSTYVENRTALDTLMTFSVNREGSVFEPDSDYTSRILENYYVYSVDEDLVIYEVNTDALTSQTVTLNGKELVVDLDYTITSSGGNGSWMRYAYRLNKELFENEGEYVIVISSTDKAENDAFSDVKGVSISFVVDKTAPIVTVAGLESNGNYQTEYKEVKVIPTDDGGILNSLLVRLVDKDGNIVKELINLTGEELRTTLEDNGGELTFTISEGLNQNVQIICSDGSVNAEGKPNTCEILYENIAVSANAVVIFFANDFVMYAGIGLLALATGGTGFIIFRKRKMKK